LRKKLPPPKLRELDSRKKLPPPKPKELDWKKKLPLKLNV
jgi:hypothetical protein